MRNKRRLTERERRARSTVMRELARARSLTWSTPARRDPVVVQHAIAAGEKGASRSCDGKVRWATFESAELARVNLERRPGTRPMESYPCPFCRSYHLATKYPEHAPAVVVPLGFRFPTRSPHLSTPIRKHW